ncbi:MAG TPA: dTDP-4-dehydrorhamnose reductase [Acidimicrobiia bacterium]|nr:dTDP-4-dehydrorhamnose reductase [Acidimicrobiia bacterium]
MKVLVTGVGGQVGSAVVAALGRHPGGHEVLGVTHADLDLAEREQVEQCVAGFRPDAIVNPAALTNVDASETDPERAYAVNALGPRYLALAGARCGAHLVHVSTDYVFDGHSARPYTEWDTTNPISEYGHSKLGGEQEVQRHASSWAIARTAWVFGRRGHDFVQLALDAAAGADYGFVDDQTGSPTYAPDLADLLLRLACERIPGLFHAVNDGACTRYRMACDVLELAGFDPDGLKVVTTAELNRPAPRPEYTVLGNLALPAAGIPRLRSYRDALAEYLAPDDRPAS